jgi:hypothetical protein
MHFLFVAQHPGTHRIQMHIVADSPQICAAWAAVHQKRFVTAPKKMTPQTVTAIESLGVGAQEPLHACAQVAARRFHNQMKMIIHQTIGVNLPPGPPAGLVQQIQK